MTAKNNISNKVEQVIYLRENRKTYVNDADKFLEKYLSDKSSKQQLASDFLSGLAKEIEIVQGLFLIFETQSKQLIYLSSYAGPKRNPDDYTFDLGEGLPGQVAASRKIIMLNNLPEEFLSIKTGLGEAKPRSLLLMPLVNNSKIIGVLELASFKSFSQVQLEFLNSLNGIVATEISKIRKTKKGK